MKSKDNESGTHTYFSTYISGLGDIVEAALKEQLDECTILFKADTLILYSTKSPTQTVSTLRFLNNTYVLLKSFQYIKDTVQSYNNVFKQTITDPHLPRKIHNILSSRKQSFRIIVSKDNQMLSPDKQVLRRLEDRLLENRNLSIDRSLPDLEFWFLIRHEGDGYFGLRITRHTAYEKILAKGELRPELSNLLCLLSEPTAQDVFLDPLAGSGSIPIERSTMCPYTKIYISDQDQEVIAKLKDKIQNLHKNNIIVYKHNALHLATYTNFSINKIVTDPPWGVHQGENLDLVQFYSSMLQSFEKILMENGVIVLLVGRNSYIEDALKNCSLSLVSKFDILVSGRKASVYKIKK